MPFPVVKDMINKRLLGMQNWNHLSDNDYDLVVVENIELLPLALKIKGGNAKVLCDLREYYPREFECLAGFRFFDGAFYYSLCRNYLDRCDALISVSPGLVREYSRQFHVDVALIRSTPVYKSVAVTTPADNIIRMVHHGVGNRNRKLENMIKLFDYLDERFRSRFLFDRRCPV